MCGITGILSYDPERSPDRYAIEAMTYALIHRGPDEHGVYLHGPVALGNRRLSIIDRAGGHQPLCNEDGSVWITYNGEIYNYGELREQLLARGHRIVTNSDTEVIVHLYEELGEECVTRLRGMFGFAIWDRRSQRLFLARDRLGIKPLYYAQGQHCFVFASELRALLASGVIERRLNIPALHDYLTFRYTVAPETMLEGISKLEPGHTLSIQARETKKKQYWDLDFSHKTTASEIESIEEFASRFNAVTRSHLVGEVPLGVLLSGGLDSTVVTAAVSALTGRQVKTFSVAFATHGQEYDERAYARLTARAYGTDHYEIALTASDFVRGVPAYVRSMEEPMADPASIPLYYVAELARKHVTVVLSGEGSDELFAGYMVKQDLRGLTRAARFRRIPAPARRWFIAPLNDRVLRSHRLERYLRLADLPMSHYPLFVPTYMGPVFNESAKRAMYGAAMLARNHFRPSEQLVVDAYRKTLDLEFIDQLLYVYTKQWLPDDLLLKADKMTMAHSLELRVPFLDHSLVEYAASLPIPMKIRPKRDGQLITKYVLRKSFMDRIPAEILNRSKKGFPVPLAQLFREDLRELARDTLESPVIRNSGLFNPQHITDLLDEHEGGHDHSHQLWTLFVFGTWMQLYNVSV